MHSLIRECGGGDKPVGGWEDARGGVCVELHGDGVGAVGVGVVFVVVGWAAEVAGGG